MLEILWKVVFFLSMLVVYAYVTSTVILIVILAIYGACVFSYYYFDNIQATIDEWLNYLYVNARFNDSMNPTHLSAYFVNRKFNKISGNGNPSVSNKKIFDPLCGSDPTFAKENCPSEARGSSMSKTKAELPSPIVKNSPVRTNRLGRDGPKFGFNKSEAGNRRNPLWGHGSLAPNKRYNTGLDLETFMNVNSPGFASRVVDKATESASYHIKYPAVRQIPAYRFDKSTLRQLSKIPKANSTPVVRIAPPEPNSIDLLGPDSILDEPENENLRSNDYLQVLRDISRKRNYCQEEFDRNIATPKKSRKSEVKNAVSSQYKRAHEDCSNDSIEDKNYKKRCDDADRNYAKIMSFTSSMSVLVPEFSWSSGTKKRKSSRLEKSKNESLEKVEKCRKIEEGDPKTDKCEIEKQTAKAFIDLSNSSKCDGVEMKLDANTKDIGPNTDETDSFFSHNMSVPEDNEEYVRVAGGKILNRTNCTYRKKLNCTKIDPVSVISTEPEYVSHTADVDDKIMKENLLNNLMKDIERKGEKTDSVIFYQNSIVEEIKKKSAAIEVQKTNSSILTSSSFNPLLPPTMKTVVCIDETDNSSATPVIQWNHPTVSLSNAIDPKQIFAGTTLVEDNKSKLDKSVDKIHAVTDVPSSNFAAPVSLPSNALMQSSSLPKNNVSECDKEISTRPTQFNMPVPEFRKENSPQLTTSLSVSVFNVSDSIIPASSRSNNENSGEMASSRSVATPSSPKLQPKSADNKDLPHSSPSITLTSSADSINKNPVSVSFGNIPQTYMKTGSNTGDNILAFGKLNGVSPTVSVELGKPLVPTLTSSTFLTNSSVPSTSDSGASSLSTATTVSTSLFRVPCSTFAAPSSTPQNQEATFSFGSQSTPVLEQNNKTDSGTPRVSIFNAGTTANTISFGTSFSPSNNAQPNIFGTMNQPSTTNTLSSSIFSANSQAASAVNNSTLTQSAPQSSIFGSSPPTSAVSTSIAFGLNATPQSSTGIQPSIFGNVGSSPLQPSQHNMQMSTLFGSSGDLPNNVFGSSQSTAPPVGVVNPLPQTIPQFGCTSTATSQFGNNNSSLRFNFNNASNQQPPIAFGTPQAPAPAIAVPATASTQPSFGTMPAASTAFGVVNSNTPQFNFNSPPSFGTTANPFDKTSSNIAPAGNSLFNFGSNNSQPAQPAFQFGAANSAPTANQPFQFGGNMAPVAATGGFSIGSGGSSSRNRPMARPRKAK